MTHEVAVHYSEGIVRQAARCFLARFIRRDAIIGGGAALLALGAWLGFGFDWPYAAALAGSGFVLVAVVVFVGLAYVRAAVGKFRAMRDPTVLWRFGDESLGTTSELGTVELKWEVVSEVWRFPDVWLLFFGSSGWGYSTLPTTSVSPELQEYILSRVTTHGGRIV
ncbi:MAG TPA: YcxB family protein [Gemmataceae bacterium]|nr:YcxB family protein [Gemmataceae bacterium]